MSNIELNNLKKENKKAFKPFILIMIVCALVGAVFGAFIAVYRQGNLAIFKGMHTIDFSRLVTKGFAIASPFVIWGGIIGNICLGVYCLRNAKKKYAKWDGENEEYIEPLENRLNFLITMTSAFLFVVYLFFSASTFAVMQNIYKETISFFLSLLGIFASMVVYVKLQKEVVDIVKIMNPEKKGSIYDLDFQKKWIQSSDEAEKFMVYKAAFGAFKAVNSLCIILFVVYFLIGCLFDTGILPIITVLGISTFNLIVYSIEAKKCEKLQ